MANGRVMFEGWACPNPCSTDDHFKWHFALLHLMTFCPVVSHSGKRPRAITRRAGPGAIHHGHLSQATTRSLDKPVAGVVIRVCHTLIWLSTTHSYGGLRLCIRLGSGSRSDSMMMKDVSP